MLDGLTATANTFETNVAISSIAIPENRLRQLRPDAVAGLVESIREAGQLQAISVLRVGPSSFRLIFGWHRLAAMRQLGMTSIRARILKGLSDLGTKLHEIDENLIRADLSPAERVMHIGERKIIYEEIYPETKHGGSRPVLTGNDQDPKLGSWPPNPFIEAGDEQEPPAPPPAAFIDETAKVTGRSRSTIARDAQRAKGIPNIADTIGTSLDKGEELDALAKMAAENQAEIIKRAKAGEKVSAKTEQKKQARNTRERDLGEATAKASQALGTKLYGVIYADPPWRFEPFSRETGMDRAADNHYPTMTPYDIAAMKVPAAADSVLFLWATASMLPEALHVMQCWGYTYKSNFVWVKPHAGTGYWNRSRHEHLLIGTRGRIPAPAPGQQADSVILTDTAAEHSAKPQSVADMIERLYPNAQRLEMFARAPRDNWDTWGNQAE